MSGSGDYLERLALVVSADGDGTAVCEFGAGGLCGSCPEKGETCRPEAFGSRRDPVRISLRNTCGAGPGQVVRVGVPARSLLLSSVISYVIPLAGMIACSWLFLPADGGPAGDSMAMLGALAGLAAGFAVSWLLAKILKRTVWNPKMLGVLPVAPRCGGPAGK